MLGGLTADKCRTRLNTALGNSADDRRNLFGNILSASNIVKEEERLCSATDDVVYAHRNGINANSVVLVHKDRHFDLCSAAVRTRNEHRLLHSGNIQPKTASKAAYIVKTTLVFRTGNVLLHKLNRLVSCRNVNACRRIAFRS